MELSDYHTHSRCSPDGAAPLWEMAAAARRAGLSQLCLTDHCDFLDLRGELDPSFRWEPVQKEFQEGLDRAPQGLTLRLGLELGGGWELPELAGALTALPELDFVIGSVHNLTAADGGMDLYFGDYGTEEGCHRVLDQYMTALARQAEQDTYDVLGHVIYPLRYMNEGRRQPLTLRPYFDRLEGVFRTVVKKGKGIEVNTCRGRTVEDWTEVLGLYRDCGGRLVTLGSDAHAPEDVGRGIAQATALLDRFGLRPATYEKRQPRL